MSTPIVNNDVSNSSLSEIVKTEREKQLLTKKIEDQLFLQKINDYREKFKTPILSHSSPKLSVGSLPRSVLFVKTNLPRKASKSSSSSSMSSSTFSTESSKSSSSSSMSSSTFSTEPSNSSSSSSMSSISESRMRYSLMEDQRTIDFNSFFNGLIQEINKEKDIELSLPDTFNLLEHTPRAEAGRKWIQQHSEQLQKVTNLCLARLKLKNLPDEIGIFTGLITLDLSDNDLTTLPDEEIIKLTELRVLNLANNSFTAVPKIIGNLHLNILNLNMNCIECLPGKENPLLVRKLVYMEEFNFLWNPQGPPAEWHLCFTTPPIKKGKFICEAIIKGILA